MPERLSAAGVAAIVASLLLLAGCGKSKGGPVDTTLPDETSSAAAPEVASEERPVTQQEGSSALATEEQPKKPRMRSPVDPYSEGQVASSEGAGQRATYTARQAMPIGNPGYWIGTNDYPTRALREEQEGTSRFRLTVDQDGRVSECTITQSSGFMDLDEATCANVRRRARFRPATDDTGAPVVGYYSSAVRWNIPRD